MTIVATETRVEYTGDGSTEDFTVPFRFLEDEHLAVYVDGELQTLTTHYTVSGEDDAEGGEVSFVDAPDADADIVIELDMDIEQPVDYARNDSFPAETHERALDRGTLTVLQLSSLVARAMRLPKGEGGTAQDWDTLLSLANRSGKYAFYFDETTGAPELFEDIGTTTLSQSVIGGHLYPQTAAELAGGVTPTNYYYPPGDVRRYGAAADGTDDYAEFARASDASLDVYVPRGTSRVATPVKWRTGQRWHGDGYSSHVYSDEVATGGIGQVFIGGTIDDGGLTDANAVAFDLDAVTKGDDYVTCSTAADASNFAAGDIVAVYGGTGYTAGGLYHKPTHQQLNEVISVDGGTGIIELRDPMYRTTATGMKIHKAEDNLGHAGNDFTPQMVGYVTVENLRLSSTLDAVTRYGGIYRSSLRNLWLSGRNTWSMNACAHNTVENIQGIINIRCIEQAYFCHDNYIGNVNIVQETGTDTDQDIACVDFKEGSHHNTVEDVRVELHNYVNGRGCTFGQGSFSNRITRLAVRANELAFAIVASNEETTMDYGANVVEDSLFQITTVSGDLIAISGAAVTTSVGLTIRRNIFQTTTIGAVMLDIDASDVLIENNDFSGCPADTLSIDSGCTNIRLIGNKWPSGTALTAFEQANVFARDNTIVGREKVETLNLRAGSATGVTSTTATNAVVSHAVPAGAFAANDELEIDIRGVLTGTDAHHITIAWDGDVLTTFALGTSADEFSIVGSIKLIGGVTVWKCDATMIVGATPDSVRDSTTSDTAAITGNGLLELRAYTGNAASSIVIDSGYIKYRARY
jgi:hypothetical protein